MSSPPMSHLVRAAPTAGSLDYYPTPPWATRALFEHVLTDVRDQAMWEPACGEGHMAETMREYGHVEATDLHDYGYGGVEDFLTSTRRSQWIITNPPFVLAMQFMLKAIEQADIGFAMLGRLSLIEGKRRYKELYSQHLGISCYAFSERLGFNPQKWDPNRDGGVTAHAWFVWRRTKTTSRLGWIPPECRDRFTRDVDRRWHE